MAAMDLRLPVGLLGSLGVSAMLFCSGAQAETWEAIDDPKALAALFSDTVLETTLESGARVVGRYDRDGTGVVEAWGDSFKRSWEVKGQDQVCIDDGRDVTCFRIERNADAQDQYRATNLTTNESLVMTLTDGPDTVAFDKPASASAGGAAEPSAQELAESLANPNTPLASLTFKLQYRTYEGDLPNADDQDSKTLLFQPAFPFPLDNGDTVFFRPAIPFQFDQPVFESDELDFESEMGLGDTTFDLAYGRTTDDGHVAAAGIVSTIPTASKSELGNNRWTLGPEFLVGKLTKSYVAALFPNHQWDIAGSGEADISLTTIQPIGVYLPGGGWNVGSAPVITFDHEEDEWTVPLNLNFGKTVIWNGRPWKLSMEVNYYVDKPDAFGPEWFIGFNIAPVVENVLARYF